MPTDNFPNTAWPTDTDAAQDRTDAVDLVDEQDFDYSDEQIRTIQEWLGSATTGQIIGDDGVSTHGPSGMVSPVADGASAVAFTLLAREDFATAGGKLLSLGDDYDAAPPAYTEKFAVDQQGILELNPITLPAAGTQGRVAYNSADDSVYRDNGTSWDVMAGGGLRDTADVIVGNTAAGDIVDETCDVIDATDNAAAMKTAIEAASSGDIIYIRPGTYNFDLAGGPSARISIPAGVTVVGPGMGAATILTNYQGGGHDGTAFLLGAGAKLMDLTCEAPEPLAAQGVFTGVVELGNDAECHRVEVEFGNSGWSGLVIPWHGTNAAFTMVGTGVSKVVDCKATNVARAADIGGGQLIRAVFSNLSGTLRVVSGLVAGGGDEGVGALSTPILVSDCRISGTANDTVKVSSSADNSQVVDNQLLCSEASVTNNAVHLNGVTKCIVKGNYMGQTQGAVSNRAVLLFSATNCVVVGNTGDGVAAAPGGWENIAQLTSGSDENIFGANNFGNGAGYVDAGTDNQFLGQGITGPLYTIETGRYDYTLVGAAPGVEEVVGQFMFDASKAQGAIKLRCMMAPIFAAAGGCNVHVDDLGAPGALAAPVRITGSGASSFKLEALASGLDYFETAAFTTHATTPSEGVMVEGERMYEVTVQIVAGSSGDTIDLGFAGLFVEVL